MLHLIFPVVCGILSFGYSCVESDLDGINLVHEFSVFFFFRLDVKSHKDTEKVHIRFYPIFNSLIVFLDVL